MRGLATPGGRARLAALYRSTLLEDVIPFWLRHGMDSASGGIFTALDRDGSLLDTDKSVWFQGRAGWMFATLFDTVEPRSEWLEAARSCVEFLRRHCLGPRGKLYFTVTREGHPLRMRRYAFSEAFAAMGMAAFAKASGQKWAKRHAVRRFATYAKYSFEPGKMDPKVDPKTRPQQGIGPRMIGIAMAQEVRACLGDISIAGRTCSEWIDASIAVIERHFLKPEHEALMETVGANGEILDHLEGRTLNPGHAIECAWFIMHEGRLRKDPRLITMGARILDWMWARGWDPKHGGLLYFTDLHGKPVQEYWHEMKFWWPHCEAIIATLLACKLTGEDRYAKMHAAVHAWSFAHFPDREHGEWFGWLRRDGSVSQTAKGNMFKGPFHLPRMLWRCAEELRGW